MSCELMTSVANQNLFYEVRYGKETFEQKIEDIAAFVTRMYRSNQQNNADLDAEEARAIQGIIYCRKRETCDQVTSALRCKGLNAGAFHRGLTQRACDNAAEQWQNAHELVKKGSKYIDVIGQSQTVLLPLLSKF